MARPTVLKRAIRQWRKGLARMIHPEGLRGFDAASWRRFAPEARTAGRMAGETIMAAPAIRARARYFVGSEPYARAAVDSLVNTGWGAGAMCAHPDAERFNAWAQTADADNGTSLDAMFALALRATVIDGEVLWLAVGDKWRLLPAEQLDETKSADLGGGVTVDAGIERAQGVRAYWIKPSLPSTQFEAYAAPIRIDAADAIHMLRRDFVGQIRGLSWFHPVLLRLHDLGLLQDTLTKTFQVAALINTWLINKDGSPQPPYDGTQDGKTLNVSREPGSVGILHGNWEHHSEAPQQAGQSIEFAHLQINAISAGLGVCAHMVSGDVSRCNYSSLRADLLKMRASVEAWQWSVCVPALNAIWRRWALLESLAGRDVADELPTWRFPQFPSADSTKDATEAKLLLEARLASRRELIAARGEDIERVDSDFAADSMGSDAATQTEGKDPDDDDEAEDT